MKALLCVLLLAVLGAAGETTEPKETPLPDEWSHNGCSEAACLTDAFNTCGTGHAEAYCRATHVKQCMKNCTDAYNKKKAEEMATWMPDAHRGCRASDCVAKSIHYCGMGKDARQCRLRFAKRCHRKCLSRRMLDSLTPKPTTQKPFECNRQNCYARSFKACGHQNEKRECRRKHVKECIKSCDKKETTMPIETAEPHLGCDHHSCTAKALQMCGPGWESTECRGHTYTECVHDDRPCRAQSFVVCGTGKAAKGCRRRFLKECKERCKRPETPKPTEKPNVTTTAPHPCSEEICLHRALDFCGPSLDHRKCNVNHFHFCMLDCPLYHVTEGTTATTVLTFRPESTNPPTTPDPKTEAPIRPCSHRACVKAAEVVCGHDKTNEAKHCRLREVNRCIAHCQGSEAARVHAYIAERCAKYSHRLEKATETRDKAGMKRHSHDLSECVRKTGLLVVGKKVLRTCKRHGRKLLECQGEPKCRRRARRRLQRCTQHVARILMMLKPKRLQKEAKVDIFEFEKCKEHASRFLHCKDVACAQEARKELVKCVQDIERNTTRIQPFTDPPTRPGTADGLPGDGDKTTQKPCSRSSCRKASFIVCGYGNTTEDIDCRVNEVIECMSYCNDITTTTPASTTDIPSTVIKTTKTTTKTTNEEFFTSVRSSYSETGVPTFNFYLPKKTTKFEDKSTVKPGKCDPDALYDMLRKCEHEACRDGVRSLMKVCDHHRKADLVNKKNNLALALNACKTLECKVSSRFALQKASYELVQREIKAETLRWKHKQAELPALRKVVRQCPTKKCAKAHTVSLVSTLEQIVVSKQKVRVLKVLAHATASEKRSINELKAMVRLKQAMTECVTTHCNARIKRRMAKTKRRLERARRHFQRERKLYKLSHKMLDMVKRQAKATVELSKCARALCRVEMKKELARHARRIEDLQDRINSRARRAHHARHHEKKRQTLAKFKALKRHLIVKRAGCHTQHCHVMYSKRIELYDRIINSVKVLQAQQFHRDHSIVHKLDKGLFDTSGHYHLLLLHHLHMKKKKKNESKECLTKLADLHAKLSKHLKHDHKDEADKTESAIHQLDCSHWTPTHHEMAEKYILSPDAIEHELLGDSATLVKVKDGKEHGSEKPKKSCWDQQADLNEAYAKALKNNEDDKASKLHEQMRLLDCNAQLLHRYGDLADRISRRQRRRQRHKRRLGLDLDQADAVHSDADADDAVTDAKTCLRMKAGLNKLLGEALKSGKHRQAAELESQMEELHCSDAGLESGSCAAKKRAAHAKGAKLQRRLVTQYNLAAACTGDEGHVCRAKYLHRIRKIKKRLRALKDVSCDDEE